MIYRVWVKEINPDIEEEILIQVNNIELICFVTNWNMNVKVGQFYDADIGVTVLDSLNIEKQADQITCFKQINGSFAYSICGKFDYNSHSIDAGIVIEFDLDEVDLFDYSYLDGKYVSIKVDRISLGFQ